VWATVKRDLARIGDNLVLVVFPFKSRDQQSAALRNWDLWGPMVRPVPGKPMVLVQQVCKRRRRVHVRAWMPHAACLRS